MLTKLRKYLILALGLGVMITGISPAHSAAAGEMVGFSIKAIQNEKQIDKKANYYDLMLEPGEEQILELDIYNSSGEVMEALIEVYTAGTNSGGVIDYDDPDTFDDSLIVPFRDIAEVESPSITIPAGSTARARVKVSMPDISFDGVMLGGVAVKKAPRQSETGNGTGATIQNEYCYVLGAMIRVGGVEVEPDFRLRHVKPTLSNYHTVIAANLQNFKAAIAKGVQITAAVYYGNNKEPLYTAVDKSFNIAPNSNFDYIIPCKGKLKPGEYRLMLDMVYDGRIWNFEESFSVSGADANDINSGAVNAQGTDYYKTATICLAMVLLLIAAAIIIRWVVGRKKRERQEAGQLG